MNKQIQKVLYYIESNLNEELDLIKLAAVANYSTFHFCRVFKVHVGESVMSYANRLKLQNAAIEMKLKNKSMIDIAMNAGYETPTGFLKAFKKRFGTTPTDFKLIMQQNFNQYEEVDMNTPEIVTREEVHVVFTRELGDYETSGEIAWKKLTASMEALDTAFQKRPPNTEMKLGKDNGEALGICHDDPDVTDAKNIRYDAALAWSKEDVAELTNYGFESKTVNGGKYVKVLAECRESLESWYGLYTWIEKKGYRFRDVPPFEKYLNAIENPENSEQTVEIYVPID